jgi:hypothetical protein
MIKAWNSNRRTGFLGNPPTKIGANVPGFSASLHRSQIPTEPVAVGAMQALAAERSGFRVIFAG